MTDQEMLEQAAKTVGAEVYGLASMPLAGEEIVSNFRIGNAPWSPLTDDGDAFRLAVKLKIDTHHEWNGSTLGDIVEAFSPEREDGARWCLHEQIGDDPARALRRAIVCCAAEIGKAMV